MYNVSSNENISKYVPNACTQGPDTGKAFCMEHAIAIEAKGIPTKLRPFIKYCGADPNRYTKEEKKKVDSVLKAICEGHVEPVSTSQGTSMILRNAKIQVGV